MSLYPNNGAIKRGDLEKAEVLIPAKMRMLEINAQIDPFFQSIIGRRLETPNVEDLRDALLSKPMPDKLKTREIVMDKSINILDKDYASWVKELVKRYRRSQIKAAIRVNVEQLKYNWLLGHDIVEMHVEERWGGKRHHPIEQGSA